MVWCGFWLIWVEIWYGYDGFGLKTGLGEKRVCGSVDDLLFGYGYMVSVWYCDMV